MRSVTIDIWDKLRERISVPQREILGRSLRFTITDRGVPVNLTGSTVTMYAKKPSAAIVFNALTIITAASGIAEITLTEQMIVEAGTLECSLLIVDSSANETRTQKFEIEVLASDDFTSSVESSSEYNAFAMALSTYSGLDARVTDTESDITALQASNSSPVGEIKIWPAAVAPTRYLLCDGAAVSRTTYADLFAVIGTTYGVGDNSTTFDLPNLKGKVVVGLDVTQTEFDALGETGGEKTHALTVAELASHVHVWATNSGTNYPGSQTVSVAAQYAAGGDNQTLFMGTVDATGGDDPHNNLQPYLTLNYIIRALA